MDSILIRGLRFNTDLYNVSTLLMKYLPSSARCTCYVGSARWRSTHYERYPRYRTSYNTSGLVSHVLVHRRSLKQDARNDWIISTYYSDFKQNPDDDPSQKSQAQPKVSIFQKMKQMTKDYWHVLIPVHVVTSIGWVAIFYTAIRNGVDIAQLLEYMNFSEKYIDVVRNSSAGNWAITYALYKIFTPLRYTVTVGGTTVAIRYLSRLGYVKAPSFKRQSTEPAHKMSRLQNMINFKYIILISAIFVLCEMYLSRE